MNVRLDYLERVAQKNKPISRPTRWIFKELKTLIIIFCMVFVAMLIFTNINLFANSLSSSLDISDTTKSVKTRNSKTSQTNNSISTIIENNETKTAEIQNLIDKYDAWTAIEKSISPSTESILQERLKQYEFDFNTLPPTNRLIISSLGIDIPLIDSQYTDAKDFTIQNFDKELMSWVVKYPTTPAPWEWGNTLIFGHTSQERRQKNSYWTIFSEIPKLTNGDQIQVIWKGNLYQYKVVDKIIVTPKKVNETFLKYNQQWKYVTLMWCYPLGRTDKRIMIMAEQTK